MAQEYPLQHKHQRRNYNRRFGKYSNQDWASLNATILGSAPRNQSIFPMSAVPRLPRANDAPKAYI